MLLLLPTAAFYLFFSLFIFPSTPIYQDGDQALYLHDAARMFEGQVIYQDFFQYTLPGTDLVYLALIKVFGVRAWIPNVMVVLLGVTLTWLTVVIGRKVFGSGAAFLPALPFLTFGFSSYLDGGNSWYTVLGAVSALAVVIGGRTPARLGWAGALCGLASCFNQVRGTAAVLGLAVFCLWEWRHERQSWEGVLRRGLCLFGGFLIPILAVNGYFVWRVGLKRFLYCTVTFVVNYYPARSDWNNLNGYMARIPPVHGWRGLPSMAIWLFIHSLVPLVYFLFFARYRREAKHRPLEPWSRLMLLSIMGLFLFMGVAPAPAYVRLCSVSLPALIIFVWLISSPRKLNQVVLRLLWIIGVLLAISRPLRTQIHWRAYLDTPSGRTVYLDPLIYEKHQWVAHRTRPTDFFFQALWPGVYYPLGLRNPAEVNMISPDDHTRPEQARDVLEGLEKHQVRFVLWSLDLDMPYEGRFSADHLGPLRAYLRAHYHVVRTFADFDQVWERNE